MIAIEGIWFCKRCKKATRILYIDVEDKDGINKTANRYCPKCLDVKGIKRLKDIPLYNQNLEEK